MTSSDPLEILRYARAAFPPENAPTPNCLDIHTLGSLADGSVDPQVRSAALPHLAACARCRAALASIAHAIGDPDIAREVAAAEATRRWSWRRLVLPVAAAAALVLVLGPLGVFRRTGEDEAHRAPTLTNGSRPTPHGPVGSVGSAFELRWSAVAGADRYRVTLFDSNGRVRYEAEPVDPVAPLPDSLKLVPGQRYLWRVDARVGFDRWVSSDLVEFSLAPDPVR